MWSAPEPEPGCGACHDVRPADVHAAMPCTSCHLGDATATTKAEAHATLVAPGALATVDRTCGTCHPEEVARVRTSPMTTGRGIVGVDRFVFGELPTPDTEETLADVLGKTDPTPAEDHVRRLCAGCHLGAPVGNRDDALRGGPGCDACHAGPAPGGHPSVDRKVADDRCTGCHSRSARIALTYAGRVEGTCDDTLPDGRTTCPSTPDVHAAAGLGCIDCHVHTELMGDGTSRNHEEEQVEVRCGTCHGEGAGAIAEDPVTARLPAADGTAVATRGTPLWNVAGGTLTGKLDGKAHPVAKVAADHGGVEHARLECTACHATVAPTCTSCHTTYDPTGTQWDFGAAAEAAGAWHEDGAAELLAPPTLGVGADGRIRPAIPGMIATLAGREVRRFALVDPHATGASRSCRSCHASPVTVGLGSGTLDARAWRFTAAADDGWTTLDATTPGAGTRVGARSLDAGELRRVLRVGICLECHEAGPSSWAGARPPACALPQGWWDDNRR